MIFNDADDFLIQEDLEKAKKEADRAMMPRDKDGNIVGIIPTGPGPIADMVGQVYYPALKPDRNGCVPPILFDRDFAGGQLPEYMEYAPGWERPDRPYDGKTLDGIIYRDPIRNLPPIQQTILRQYSTPPVPPVKEVSPDGAFLFPPQRRVFASPQGMAVQTAEDTADLLSNFQVRATRRHIIKRRGEPDGEEFVLEVICKGERRSITVRGSELEDVVPIIVKRFPTCHTVEDASKASVRIANAIRDQISSLHTVVVVKSPGFINLRGRWVYAHDGISSDGSVAFRTGCTIPCDTEISPREALRSALGVLELAPKSPTMLALLLVGHTGLLYNLYEEAGIPPQYVTLLLGATGSFKTSTALALFRPFSELPKTPEATFRDTKAALEVKIGAACSRVLIIDDFQPAVTSAAGKEMLEKLELVIRMFGDGIAKSRSNSDLGRAKEFHPAGCCVITGEDRGGSHSTLLRCLVLSIQPGEIFGDRLKFFQDHPEFLRTHYYYFVQWVGENGDRVIEFLRQEFQHERELFAETIHEPRQVDIAASLMLTARLLIAYMQEVLSLSDEETADICQRWANTLVELLRRSEEETVEMDPARMYLEALFGLQSAGRVRIASDQASFKPGQHIGFAKDDCWWLLPHETYAHILRYWDEQKERFPLKEGKSHAALAQADLIKVSQENRKGRVKSLYTIKSTLEGRPRMLVLHIEQAQTYLENNGK